MFIGAIVCLFCVALFLLAGPIAWAITICLIIGIALWLFQTLVALIAPIFVYLIVAAVVALGGFIALVVWATIDEKSPKTLRRNQEIQAAHAQIIAEEEAQRAIDSAEYERADRLEYLRNAVTFGEAGAVQIQRQQDAELWERQEANRLHTMELCNRPNRIKAEKRQRRADRMRAVAQGISATQQTIEGGLKVTAIGVGVAAVTAELLTARHRAAEADRQSRNPNQGGWK